MSKNVANEANEVERPGESSRCKREDSPDAEFCCAICLEVLLDPISLPCGHNLDEMCLQKLSDLPEVAQRCPFCRAGLPRTLPKVR